MYDISYLMERRRKDISRAYIRIVAKEEKCVQRGAGAACVRAAGAGSREPGVTSTGVANIRQ
jgi:hypothetical protein